LFFVLHDVKIFLKWYNFIDNPGLKRISKHLRIAQKETYLKENQVDDIEEEFGAVEPKELVTRLKLGTLERARGRQGATGLHSQRCNNVLQLHAYGYYNLPRHA